MLGFVLIALLCRAAEAGLDLNLTLNLSSFKILAPCPRWIAEYSTWHADTLLSQASQTSLPNAGPQQMLGESSAASAPGGPKFMLHSCGLETSYFCSGIGDRMRAMLETVRLARFSRR